MKFLHLQHDIPTTDMKHVTNSLRRLGTFYNAITGKQKKEEVRKWAAEKYPEAWQRLLQHGEYPRRSRRDGEKLFKLSRTVRA